MFIINPLTGRGMDNLFSTHPNTENRIAELRGDGARDGADRAAARWRRWPRSSDRRRSVGAAGAALPRDGSAARGARAGGEASRSPPSNKPTCRGRADTSNAAKPVAAPAPQGLPAREAAVAAVDGGAGERRTPSTTRRDQGNSRAAPLEPRDRAFARLIAATVLRRLGELEAVLNSFLEKPLPQAAQGALWPILLSRRRAAPVSRHAAARRHRPRRRSVPARPACAAASTSSSTPCCGAWPREGAAALAGARTPSRSTFRPGCCSDGRRAYGDDDGAAHRRGVACARRRSTSRVKDGAGGVGRAARRHRAADGHRCGSPPAAASRICRATPTARGGCRTRPPRCRRGCSAPVAGQVGRRSVRGAGRQDGAARGGRRRVTAVDLSSARLKRLERQPRAAAAQGRAASRPTPRPGRRAHVRCGAARCAVHGDRHHSPPSRHPAPEAPRRRRRAGRPAGAPARQRGRGSWRRAARSSTAPARSSPRRAPRRSSAFCSRQPGLCPRADRCRRSRALRPTG